MLSTNPKDDQMWSFTQHCCRVCFGRVLVRTTFERKKIHKCSCCGTTVECEQPSGLCACGVKIRGGTRDAGIRCRVNDKRTPENPMEIIAEQIDPTQISAR